MKHIIKNSIYCLSIGAMGLVCACSNMLDTQPMTTKTDSNYYTTPAEAQTALVGCYAGLEKIWNSNSINGIALPVASEIESDNCYAGMGTADFPYSLALDQFDINASPASTSIFSSNWTAYYKAINSCNTLIGKIDQVDWTGNEAKRKSVEGEVHFLRAYYYFDLVRLFQNIPLITEPTSDNVPQADPKDVYSLIASDLKFAIENCNTVPYPSIAPTEYGHANKYAAEALMARVFLFYTGYYNQADLNGITKANALSYVEDVISNGGYGLVPDFHSLFPASAASADVPYAGEDNQETVFSIKYNNTGDYNPSPNNPQTGNTWMIYLGLRTPVVSYPYFYGWGACPVTSRLWSAFSSDDTRRTASIISIVGEGIDFSPSKDAREYTGYYLKKYSPMCDKNGKSITDATGGKDYQIGQSQDYIVIRYSDVLLMAAELGSGNAQAYLDAVRKRAFPLHFVSVPATKENILAERRLEFVGEGIRYYDLLRQGIDYAANALAESNTPVLNGGAPGTVTISAANFKQTGGFNQIPESEISLSGGVLKQNPGW